MEPGTELQEGITLDGIKGSLRVAENEINAAKIVYTATELLNRKVTKLPCLIDPILPKVGVAALAGSSDTGKSSFLRHLASVIVLGKKDFLGWKIKADYNKVIYVSTEDDDIATSFQLSRFNMLRQLDTERYSGLKYIFDTENILDTLTGILENERHDLIIIDAFTDLYGKGMNDSNQVRTFLNEYSQLAQRYKCLVIFLHHTGKGTEDKPPSKNNLLGSQGFEAKMRLVIELRTDPMEPSLKHMCIVKGNYLPKEMKNESFVLRFDEDLSFTNTSERIPFQNLTPLTSETSNTISDVKNLHAQGKTQIEIAEILNISQSKVSRILKK